MTGIKSMNYDYIIGICRYMNHESLTLNCVTMIELKENSRRKKVHTLAFIMVEFTTTEAARTLSEKTA